MFTTKHRMWFSSMMLAIVVVAGALMIIAYKKSLQSPPNILWSLFSGYYRYDPRHETPPSDLFSDRPEPSLKYFFEATLKRCQGKYPPLSPSSVAHYEVEEVEYFGYTSYHAFSSLHTRIYFADGTSVRAVFRFEAGHNEAYPLFLIDKSTIRAGAWMSLGSLLRDPDIPPPGWSSYDQDLHPLACNPGPPYAVDIISTPSSRN